jgi:hypothetical protein
MCGLGRRMRVSCAAAWLPRREKPAEPDAALQVPDPGFDDGLSSLIEIARSGLR